MANGTESIETLLTIRKLTRAISDVLKDTMTGYLSTLTPLLRPRLVFGDHIQGSSKEVARHADAALKELTTLYERVAASKPFSLRTQLTPPLRLSSTTFELAPMEYSYRVSEAGDTRTLAMRSPLKWHVSYAGFSPGRLRELLASRQRSIEELNDTLISYLVLHIVFTQQSGVTGLLRDLHFPVTTEYMEEFGEMPLTCIGSSISTRRPSDSILVQSAQLSGMDAFEEVVQVDDISALRDPVLEKLAAILAAHSAAPGV